MTILTILQARMTSSRLPGKVLKPVLGEPMMGRQIERLRRSRSLGRLVTATSTDPSDDAIVHYCATIGCPTYRGSLQDVLSRYAGALEAFGPADHVVRLTADCPLADWRAIDEVIALHLETGADYTSNTVDRSFPKGLDVEIFRAALLPEIAAATEDPYDREHVTPFFYRNPDRFRIEQLVRPERHDEVRWTVDTPEDFAFATAVYEALYPGKPAFDSDDIWTVEHAVRDDAILRPGPSS